MTQGCRWQESSFNVAVKSDEPLDICRCGAEIRNVKYHYNGETLCRNCFSSRKSLRQKLSVSDLGFNTTRDKLYHFTHQFSLNENPIDIRGKDHWRREIKKRKLTDDFEQKPKRPEDLKTPMDDFKTTDKKFIRDEILKELQEKGLRNKLIRRK